MSFEKKEQNEVKIFGCVFSLVIIQGKLIRRVMTPISRTYIFDKSTDDFFMKGNDSNLLIVFYVQIMPDDFVMQLHRF